MDADGFEIMSITVTIIAIIKLRYLILYTGLDSSVGIAIGYKAGRSGDRNPVGGEIFRKRPDWSWGPPSLCTMGIGYFPGVKRPGRAADHTHPSSVEVDKG
jgi:hypothetical protein